jgi:cyanoexosortase B-associated protein
MAASGDPPAQVSRWPKFLSLGQFVVIVLLAVVFCWAALPGYVNGGQWPWKQLPPVVSLKQMQQIPRLGIPLAHWQTVAQAQLEISGQTWSRQTLVAKEGAGVPVGTQATLLVHPQLAPLDRPKSEWNSLQRYFGWTEDELRRLALPVAGLGQPVQARFLRAWAPAQGHTTALLQWYAWPDGGSDRPGDWFWRDRQAQLQDQRSPWIAVSLMLPLEPLGPLAPQQDNATALGQAVHQALLGLWASATR